MKVIKKPGEISYSVAAADEVDDCQLIGVRSTHNSLINEHRKNNIVKRSGG